ncbi:MAG: hypothetical protein FWF92_03720 [Oscillospiraceae bacterium]|nr:hypothetical protein [Oscillospiraceae bacterium]
MKKFLASILVLVLIAIPVIVSADVDLENEDIQISMGKAAAAPVIDGKLDVDYYEKITINAGDLYYYGDMDDFLVGPNGAGLGVDFYMAYDANNIYVFLGGDASKYYYCDHDGDDTGNIWNQSCIQISLATADADGGDRLEIGLARNHETGELLSNIWAQGSDSNGKDDYEMVFGQNCAISLEGGRINYEVSIPWTTFLPAAPSAGDKIGLNWMFGWSDDGSRFGVEYSAGCNTSKDASLFSTVTLGSNVLEPAPVVVEEEPPADEPVAAPEEAAPAPAPAPAPAAPTGDAGIIMLAAVMIIAAAGVVVLKRKAVK